MIESKLGDYRFDMRSGRLLLGKGVGGGFEVSYLIY